jgi:hypothetical protein
MRLSEAMTFDGVDGSKDRTDFYLAALSSHDGYSKFRFLVTPVRIVCANTQTAAISRAHASFGISHTGGARAALAEARHARSARKAANHSGRDTSVLRAGCEITRGSDTSPGRFNAV